MKEKLRKWAPYMGYPLFYIVSLFVFLIVTFPLDKVKDRVVAEFNAEQRKANTGFELEIKDLKSHWLTGVKAKDVRLVGNPSEPTAAAPEVKIDELRARVSLLSLLVGTQRVSFHVDGFGGSIDGETALAAKERTVALELETVDLGQVGFLGQTLGIPIEGKVQGTVKVALPEGKVGKSNGSVDLKIQDMAVGDGKAKIKGMFALPRIDLGAFGFEGEIKEGQLKIAKFGATGKDVDLTGDGRIQLREAAKDAILDVSIKFKVNDAYRGKNDMTKTFFGNPGSTNYGLLEMVDPKLRQAKRPDGSFAVQLRGPLARIEAVPVAAGR